MKVVLANPSMLKKQVFPLQYNYPIWLPLGLLSIGSHLRSLGHEVTIIDAYAEFLAADALCQRILSEDADLIGISMLTPAASLVKGIIETLQSEAKECPPIVLGGPHPTLVPEKALQDTAADYVIQGEGEFSLADLISRLETDRCLSDVPGVFFLENGEIRNGSPASVIDDLDALPPYDYSLLDMKHYRSSVQYSRPARVLNLIYTRGCAFSCSFCASRQLRNGVTSYSLERMQYEIETLVSRFNCERIHFIDPLFPPDKKRGMAFCQMMIDSGLNKKVAMSVQSRVELLSEEMVTQMREAGCYRISMGIESGNEEVLRSIGKHFTPDQALEAARRVRSHGIVASGNFLFGHNDDTMETMQDTFDLAMKMDLDEGMFGIMIPFPGTRAHELAMVNHERFCCDWDHFSSTLFFGKMDVPFVPKGLTPEQLKQMRHNAFMRFYFRPKILWREFRRFPLSHFLFKYLVKSLNLLAVESPYQVKRLGGTVGKGPT